jgi:hypothetical protein
VKSTIENQEQTGTKTGTKAFLTRNGLSRKRGRNADIYLILLDILVPGGGLEPPRSIKSCGF